MRTQQKEDGTTGRTEGICMCVCTCVYVCVYDREEFMCMDMADTV